MMAAVFAAPSKAQAQTTLTQGDLAIIGVSLDSSPYMDSVVALREIAAVEVIWLKSTL